MKFIDQHARPLLWSSLVLYTIFIILLLFAAIAQAQVRIPPDNSSERFGITGNNTGSTGSVVGTLAAVPGRVTYICGFNVSAIGGTAAVGPIAVQGIVGTAQVYQAIPATTTGAFVITTQNFTPCIPASAPNTAITVATTADGTASAVDVNVWGFQWTTP